MVGFVSEPILEEDLKNQPSKTITITDPIDQFLDFESLKEWFEDNPNPDSFSLRDNIEFEKSIASMGDNEHLDKGVGVVSSEPVPFVDDIKSNVEHTGGEINDGANVKEENRELEGNLGVCIEKEMEKVSLVTNSASDSTDVKKEIVGDKEESESSEESESESESEDSDSSSASSRDSDDEKENKGLDKKEMKKKVEVDGEIEEGEIKGDDEIEEEDVDKMVSWTDDEDDDSEEGDVKKMFSGSDTEILDLEEVDEDSGMVKPIVSKNELQELPPVHQVDVTLEPHHQLLPVGAVLSIFGPKVIVEGAEKHDPLNEGSILWITESRSPLGLIDEIFGPVKTPYYVVRYNSEDEVPEGILEGTLVSFVPEFANHVLNDNNSLYKKGYDVSGEHDEEVLEEEVFSDDEKEAEYRRMQKMNKRGINDQKPQNKKKNRNKDKTWKSGGQSPAGPPPDQFQPNQNQSQGPPEFVNRSASASPFPQSPFPPGANMAPPNALWNNAVPCQQPQNWNHGMPCQPQQNWNNTMPCQQQPQNAVFPQGQLPNNGGQSPAGPPPDQFPPNQNQSQGPPEFVNRSASASPFPQSPFPPGANMAPPNALWNNAGPCLQPQNWNNGMPCQPQQNWNNTMPCQQQPQNAVFPQGQLPNNGGFPWFLQNAQQLPYQMVMPPNFMQFPMQFNPKQQNVLNNFFPAGGQPNFFPPPLNAPWRGQGQGPIDQNMLNQTLSGPNAPWRGPIDQNLLNQTLSGPNAPWRGQSPMDQNMLNQKTSGMVLQGQAPANVVQEPAMVPNATTNPSQFNMGSPPSSHGNRPYRGKGGRGFSRGRGRGFSRGRG